MKKTSKTRGSPSQEPPRPSAPSPLGKKKAIQKHKQTINREDVACCRGAGLGMGLGSGSSAPARGHDDIWARGGRADAPVLSFPGCSVRAGASGKLPLVSPLVAARLQLLTHLSTRVAPQPPLPWQAVFNATSRPPSCPQQCMPEVSSLKPPSSLSCRLSDRGRSHLLPSPGPGCVRRADQRRLSLSQRFCARSRNQHATPCPALLARGKLSERGHGPPLLPRQA